jgi:hypothetical protein
MNFAALASLISLIAAFNVVVAGVLNGRPIFDLRLTTKVPEQSQKTSLAIQLELLGSMSLIVEPVQFN